MVTTDRERMSPYRDAGVAAIMVILAFATRAVFMYQDGMGDPDPIVMAAGMASGVSDAVDLGDTLLYGGQLSPGVYAAFKVIYPIFYSTPSHVLTYLNWVSVLCVSLLVFPLYLVFRRTLAPHEAAGAILLFIFSPIAWELGTYFHPLIPATLLFFLSVLAWDRVCWSVGGVVWFLITYLLGSASLLTRTEILFVVPALFLAALLSERRRRNSVLLLLLVGLVIATYLAVLRTAYSPSTVGRRGLGQYLELLYTLYTSTFSVAGMVRSAVWAALGVGAVTVCLAVLGLLRALMGRRTSRPATRLYGWVLVAVFWILPSLLFWLPQPVPILRHYFLAVIGISWLVGGTILIHQSPKTISIVISMIVVLNLLLPEFLYRGYNATHRGSEKEPHGAFFYYHGKVENRIARYDRLQKEMSEVVARTSRADNDRPAGAVVVVNWETYGYVLYWMASTRRVQKLSETSPEVGIFTHSYDVDGADITLLHLSGRVTDAARSHARSRILQSKTDGFAVFVPTERLGDLSLDESEGVLVY